MIGVSWTSKKEGERLSTTGKLVPDAKQSPVLLNVTSHSSADTQRRRHSTSAELVRKTKPPRVGLGCENLHSIPYYPIMAEDDQQELPQENVGIVDESQKVPSLPTVSPAR